MAKLHALLHVLVISGAVVVTAKEFSAGYKLNADLFDGYDRQVRPTKGYNNSATEIEVIFNLQAIVNMDERQQMMVTNGVLYMLWNDSFLSWNASDYGHIKTVIVPQDEVWLPDINVLNTVTPTERLGYEGGPVLIENNSLVTWQPHCVFETACQIDITYFPFDIQNCSLVLGTRQSTIEEVRIVRGAGGIFFYDFSPNSQWKLIRSDVDFEGESNYLSKISIKLVVRRRPTKIVCNILVPVMFLSVTAVLVFLLPIDGGDRVGTAVTILLSYAVYLTIVADSLPMNAKTISCVEMYLLFLIFVATLIAITNVFLTDMCNREGRLGRIPSQVLARMRTCVFLEPCHQWRRKRRSKGQIHISETEDLNHKEIDPVDYHPSSHDASSAPRITWVEAAKIVDRILFILFAFATGLGSAIFYGILLTGPTLPPNNIIHSDNPSAAL